VYTTRSEARSSWDSHSEADMCRATAFFCTFNAEIGQAQAAGNRKGAHTRFSSVATRIVDLVGHASVLPVHAPLRNMTCCSATIHHHHHPYPSPPRRSPHSFLTPARQPSSSAFILSPIAPPPKNRDCIALSGRRSGALAGAKASIGREQV